MAELFDSLQAPPVLRTFVQNITAFCSRPETTSDVISGIFVGPVLTDKYVNVRDHRLNLSEKNQPNSSETTFFGRFSNFDNCRSEYLVMAYSVWLLTMSIWIALQNSVILC